MASNQEGMRRMNIVALIPAKSTSQRVKHKNIKKLAGVPLMAYTIRAAIDSDCFEQVIVSTDSLTYSYIAEQYGATVIMRPEIYASPMSPDIDWVHYTMRQIWEAVMPFAFALLRPTSPFRLVTTIRRAVAQFEATRPDSIRAVERVIQHPGKMWYLRGSRLFPLLMSPEDEPWHSQQTQSLPEVWVQNASLEIANTRMMFDTKTIAGTNVEAFHTIGVEGFDINTAWDFIRAEYLIKHRGAVLPEVE